MPDRTAGIKQLSVLFAAVCCCLPIYRFQNFPFWGVYCRNWTKIHDVCKKFSRFAVNFSFREPNSRCIQYCSGGGTAFYDGKPLCSGMKTAYGSLPADTYASPFARIVRLHVQYGSFCAQIGHQYVRLVCATAHAGWKRVPVMLLYTSIVSNAQFCVRNSPYHDGDVCITHI